MKEQTTSEAAVNDNGKVQTIEYINAFGKIVIAGIVGAIIVYGLYPISPYQVAPSPTVPTFAFLLFGYMAMDGAMSLTAVIIKSRGE